MTDVFTISQRSKIMRKVKSSRNLSTEMRLLFFLKKYRITGWRRKYQIIGKPDFAFPSLKLIVFVDGCFWHGHNCRNTTPKTNQQYWATKLQRNRERDILVNSELQKRGWKVERIWECDVRNETQLIEIFSKYFQFS